MISKTAETTATIEETKNFMALTKWITIVPVMLKTPLLLLEVLLRINPNFAPIALAYFFLAIYMSTTFIYPVITIRYNRSFRIAFVYCVQKAICRGKSNRVQPILMLNEVPEDLHACQRY